MEIAGVHGIGNYKPRLSPSDAARELSDKWTQALQKGVTTVKTCVHVAYYAHHLADKGRQSASDDLNLLTVDEQEVLRELALANGILVSGAQSRSGIPVRILADWIVTKYNLDNRSARRLMAIFCREVVAYFNHSENREKSINAVRETIQTSNAKIVVAHSLGSVVAFECLAQNPQLEVDLLVTMGSPLALPNVVFDKVRPGPIDGKLKRPNNVGWWINIADPSDIVAVPRDIDTYVDGIDKTFTDSIGFHSFHQAEKYLESKFVAAAIMSVQE